MKPTPSPQSRQRGDEEIIKILRRVGSLSVEYPAGLFAARRAAFILQVQQQDNDRVENRLSSTEQFIQHFESLKFARADYPPELLAARRAAFIELVEQHSRAEVSKEVSQDQEIIQLFQGLKSVETKYPPNLMSARRAAFKRQIAQGGRISVLEALRTSLRTLFLSKAKTLSMPTMNMMRTSLVVIVLTLVVFVGSLLRSGEQAFNPPASQSEVAQPGTSSTTSTGEAARVICKPGYVPPLCLAKEFDKSHDLSFMGNGTARPAVAKDTLPGYSGVHKPAYVNDGLYGPGASWISNSPYSWIKIDLGKATTINTVAFGRDRLGNFNDRDPGQFVIAVALSDNVYADGNSSNDYVEYTEVYNSDQLGFDGTVSGSETIQAEFRPIMARFVKIVFANAGTAVDEVEVFMAQPPKQPKYPTQTPKQDLPVIYATFAPTDTSVPANTATPVPTDTAIPIPTDTPVPAPTDTAIPIPTDTPEPPPTTPPQPMDTSIPPTDVLVPVVVPTEETPIPINGP